MLRYPRLFALAVLALSTTPTLAQFPGDDLAQPKPGRQKRQTIADISDITFAFEPARAKRGETVIAKLIIAPKKDAYTYPFFPKDPTQSARNNLELPAPNDLVFLPGTVDPAGLKEKERAIEPDKTDQYYPDTKPPIWEFRVVVSPRATPGKKIISFGPGTALQVCRESCIRITRDELPKAELEVLDADATNPNAADLTAAEKLLGSPTRATGPSTSAAGPNPVAQAPVNPIPQTGEVGRKPTKPLDEYRRELDAIRESLVHDDAGGAIDPTGTPAQGLGGFIATAALWGLISLVTPCVFPMIPITVSIFLKQAHGSMKERLKLAGVYSLTIITVLGFSAFALLKFMAALATHPVTNIALGALFLVLALSLFGMYELTLPNVLVRRLQSKQAKGGVIGTVFGALAFTVISFTCVAPFLGGFAGISAASAGEGSLIGIPTTREVLGGLAFATAFAAPFFVLALVPGLLKALPRSGGWLDSVKVVMGFLELAAALKFLRTAELRILPSPEYFTYDLVLAGWVAISVACGLYLLNLYRLPHDEERPNIGVPRLLFAAAFLGLAVYLAPALFKAADGKHPRPAGAVYAWVEAFLLPEFEAGTAGTDLREAIDLARKSKKPVFVDFTGVTCTNCGINERSVFTRPEVKGLLDQFVAVRLYGDEVPAEAYQTDPGKARRDDEGYANEKFQVAAFGTNSRPTYVVLIPNADGKTVRVFRESTGERRARIEGKINSPADFAAFLRAALEAAR
jgi:thiol:disulfide interchange protein DsbD